jgi:hypothetical protein
MVVIWTALAVSWLAPESPRLGYTVPPFAPAAWETIKDVLTLAHWIVLGAWIVHRKSLPADPGAGEAGARPAPAAPPAPARWRRTAERRFGDWRDEVWTGEEYLGGHT